MRVLIFALMVLSLNFNSASFAKSFNVNVLPDSCGKAFQELNLFQAFYESSISLMVVKRYPGRSKLYELFAVSEMRKNAEKRFKLLAVESPIDRLIISQLCHFRQALLDSEQIGERDPIRSDDKRLHQHLADVSTKLYRDSRSLYHSMLKQEAQLKAAMKAVKGSAAQVSEYRRRGRAKVSDLLRR